MTVLHCAVDDMVHAFYNSVVLLNSGFMFRFCKDDEFTQGRVH